MIDVGLTLRQLAQPHRKAPPPAPSQTQPPPAAAAGAAAAGAATVGAAKSQQRRSRSSRRPSSRSRRRRSRSRRHTSSSRSRRRRKRGSRSRRRRKPQEEEPPPGAGEAEEPPQEAAEAAENAEEEPPPGAGEVDEAEVAEDLLALHDVKEEIHSPAEDEGVHPVEPLQAPLAPALARRKGLQRPPFLPFGLLPPGTCTRAQAVPPGRVPAPTAPPTTVQPTTPQRPKKVQPTPLGLATAQPTTVQPTTRIPAPPKTLPPGYNSAPTTPQRRVPVGRAASSDAPAGAEHEADTAMDTELPEADPPWRANSWRSRGYDEDEDAWPSWKTY
jgi:hypothetical protein